ncbi:hypothetical protein PI126_g7216 [Phytophthora idaei]|nr:hypothetical protein PI126_g7216 [Phytophthora idaei]
MRCWITTLQLRRGLVLRPRMLHIVFLLLCRRYQPLWPHDICRSASSAKTRQDTVRKSPAKQRRKPQKAAATGKRRRSSRVKPPSYDKELSGASPDDADSDEEEAPVPSAPVASATGNTVPQPAMSVGRQAQDEDGADFDDEGGSIANSVEEKNRIFLLILLTT